MMKSTDEIKGIIAGWASLCPAWNDTKSKYVEDNVISVLENAIVELENQMNAISMFSQKIEEKVEDIERIGDSYGW